MESKMKKASAKDDKKMGEMMNDLLAKAGVTLLPDEIAKLGRDAIAKGLNREGLEISRDSLKAFRAGLTLAISSPEGEGKQMGVMLLMLVSRLVEEEK